MRHEDRHSFGYLCCSEACPIRLVLPGLDDRLCPSCRIIIHDLETSRGVLAVRCGKGGKDRWLPVGNRAMEWLQHYINEVRINWATIDDTGELFLTQFGKRLSSGFLTEQVTRYLEKAGLKREGACHLFRHSMATHMLDNGADIRYIQAMLGHSHLSTTQVYTHVSLTRLKQVHNQTHPAIKKAKRTSPTA